jgi:hypothetical protein
MGYSLLVILPAFSVKFLFITNNMEDLKLVCIVSCVLGKLEPENLGLWGHRHRKGRRSQHPPMLPGSPEVVMGHQDAFPKRASSRTTHPGICKSFLRWPFHSKVNFTVLFQ